MNIHYDYYKVFYYVAKYKSITGAAHALFQNQPNITRMMKKLEEELGCMLFVRQRHGVSLTSEGEKLYRHVSIAMEHLLCGEEEIARNRSLQGGIVTIAASEIALHCVLLPILKKFRKAYPGIRIKVSSHSTPQAMNVLKKGLADFAVVTDPFQIPAGFCTHNIRGVQEIPICSTAFGLTDGNILTREQLDQYPLIGLGEETASFAFYSTYFGKMGLPFSPDVEASTADQILPMVKSDLGIGFVPDEFLQTENMENVVVLKMKIPVPERNICMVKRKDAYGGIAADELEKMILQEKFA